MAMVYMAVETTVMSMSDRRQPKHRLYFWSVLQLTMRFSFLDYLNTAKTNRHDDSNGSCSIAGSWSIVCSRGVAGVEDGASWLPPSDLSDSLVSFSGITSAVVSAMVGTQGQTVESSELRMVWAINAFQFSRLVVV